MGKECTGLKKVHNLNIEPKSRIPKVKKYILNADYRAALRVGPRFFCSFMLVGIKIKKL